MAIIITEQQDKETCIHEKTVPFVYLSNHNVQVEYVCVICGMTTEHKVYNFRALRLSTIMEDTYAYTDHC